MNTHPILYSFRRCPWAMRARLGLVVSEQVVEIREVDLKNKPADMLKFSPKGTVPTLVLAHDHVIDESLDVLRWALERGDPEGWMNFGQTTLVTQHDLIKQNDGPFVQSLRKYKYFQRHPDQPQAAYRAEGEVFLKILERRLENGTQPRPFFFADHISLADIAIFPLVRQFALVDEDWWRSQSSYPRLVSWLDHFINSPLFDTAMTKYDVWTPGQACNLFPQKRA